MIPGSSFNSETRATNRPHASRVRRFGPGAGLIAFWFAFASGCAPRAETFSASSTRYPADGASGGVILFERGTADDALPHALGPRGDTGAIFIIRREALATGERIFFRSTNVPGSVEFSGRSARLRLHFQAIRPDSDQDGDGFPDAAELVTEQDRRAFRDWFVRISQSQFMRPSYAWRGTERDCSGLIRFAYREALKRHDRAYQERSGIVLDKNLPDVQRFTYPDVPVLGRRLFRVQAASASRGFDVTTEFAPFASAEFLMKHNTRLIARDIRQALPGDILFFLNERRQTGNFHSMIVTEAAPRPEGVRLIYHTGGPAGLKRVSARYLFELPDRRFRPLPENPHFLGVFRFLILE